jgi:outer membrane protein OmpA-like peptidoglycan-associated protein
LTPDDCSVLRQVYGVTPQDCIQATAAAPPPVAPDPVPATAKTQAPTPLPQLPAEPQAVSEPLPAALRIDNVFFRGGGAVLDDAARRQLDSLVGLLESAPMQGLCLHLAGHADGIGPPDVNVRLSVARADTVATYLKGRLRDPGRVIGTSGRGSGEPLEGVSADSSLNRRVTVLVGRCGAGTARG